MVSRFSAAGSALGYLAQVDYALLAALERLDKEPDFAISLETFDDIVFHDSETGDPTEKWQTKHTISTTRSLSDASVDLWKTIGNWIAEPGRPDMRLVLLAVAPAGDAARLLRPEGAGRDVPSAQAKLEIVARDSTNADNAASYKAFLDLAPDQRRALLERVEVIDGAAPAAGLRSALELAVRKSVRPQRRAALVDRLSGWWHRRTLDHLGVVATGKADLITAGELETELHELAESLQDQNLPIDVLDMQAPTDAEMAEDNRIFVAQLILVSMASERVRQCIYDHNRAFAQRSRWARDELVEVGELGRYDRELSEAWARFFLPVSDSDPELDDEEAGVRRALELFVELDRSNLPAIRRDVREGWVARGSLHMIADRLEIGWHPSWLEHLKHRLAEVRDEPPAEAAA